MSPSCEQKNFENIFTSVVAASLKLVISSSSVKNTVNADPIWLILEGMDFSLKIALMVSTNFFCVGSKFIVVTVF